MRFTRHRRFHAALLALFSMLFMQLAVAGYVCPLDAQQAKGSAVAAVQDAQADPEAMPGCAEAAQKETASAHLCHTHCQVESQSLDKHELPAFQVALPDPVLSVIVLSMATSGLDENYSQPACLTRVVSPPLSIRNCCFRT